MDLFKKVSSLVTNYDDFIKSGEFRKLRKGQICFNQGEEATHGYFVVQGELNLLFYDKKKEEDIFLEDYEAGTFVGYYGARAKRTRMANLVAVKNSEVFAIHMDKMTQHIIESKELASFMLQRMSDRIMTHEARIASLRILDSKGRLANYLISIAGSEMSHQIRLPKIQNVASTLHMEKETLSRQLRQIEEEGYISRSHKDVTILNFDGLKELAI